MFKLVPKLVRNSFPSYSHPDNEINNIAFQLDWHLQALGSEIVIKNNLKDWFHSLLMGRSTSCSNSTPKNASHTITEKFSKVMIKISSYLVLYVVPYYRGFNHTPKLYHQPDFLEIGSCQPLNSRGDSRLYLWKVLPIINRNKYRLLTWAHDLAIQSSSCMAINLLQTYVTCLDAIISNIMILNMVWSKSIPRVKQQPQKK